MAKNKQKLRELLVKLTPEGDREGIFLQQLGKLENQIDRLKDNRDLESVFTSKIEALGTELRQSIENISNLSNLDYESIVAKLSELEHSISSLTSGVLKDQKDKQRVIKETAKILDGFKEDLDKTIEKTNRDSLGIKKDIEVFKNEVTRQVVSISQKGGGSKPLQVSNGGSLISTRYSDLNFVGSGVTITAADNNTTKKVDLTFTATGGVTSVNGKTGVVTLTTTDIPEGSNLYFTNARAITALTGQNISIFTNNAGYLTANQSISLTGDVTGSGATSIATTVTKINGVAYNADPLTQYALLAGRSGGQSLSGGTAANDDLTLQGTTNSTRTTSYVILQPNGGNMGIGTTTPVTPLQAVWSTSDFRFSQGTGGVTPTLVAINTDASGKAVGLGAGTSGAAFFFDSAGFFAVQAETKSAFTGNTLGSGSLLMRIEGTGNVSIGAGLAVGYSVPTTPLTSGLSVSGSVGIGADNTNYKLNIKTATDDHIGVRSINGDIQLLAHNDADNAYQILQVDGSTLVLNKNSGGKVGIGTSSPGTLLEVAGVISMRQGNSSSVAKVGGSTFDHFTDVGNSTTTETDLYSDSIPASSLGTNGDKLSAEYGGTFVSSGTATREVRIYFGGTSIFDTGALTLSLSAAWTVYVSIIKVSATVIRYMVSFTTEGAALSAYTAVGELTGLTLSNANILKVTGQAAGIGAATNDIVAKMGHVEWLPAA